jgi:hypothetical protein
MRLLALIASGAVLSTSLWAQKLVEHTSDWISALPEIPGCERVIGAMKRTGTNVEQTVSYERGVPARRTEDPNYVGCGSVTIRVEPNARKNAKALGKAIGFGPHPSIVRGFFALRDGPLCGNDSWLGSTSVFFDKDKVLIVSANQGAEVLLDFAEKVDYSELKRELNRYH